MEAASFLLPPLSGAVLGFAAELLLFDEIIDQESRGMVAARFAAAAVCGALLFHLVRLGVRRLLRRALAGSRVDADRFLVFHSLAYLMPLAYGLLLIGYRLSPTMMWLGAVGFVAVHLVGVVPSVQRPERDRLLVSRTWLAILFFLSGVAALIYQVTWQRAMFTAFGVNIESVTVIVTVFMLGLGLGSLVGGALSRRAPARLPLLFMACETSIGLFGLVSLPLIRTAGALAITGGSLTVAAAMSALLLPPTMVMGATLPILVEYLHTSWRHVGRTVGLLYFVNTLGSAAACFLTADLLFALGGQAAAVTFAAVCNLSVGLLVFQYARRLAAAGGQP